MAHEASFREAFEDSIEDKLYQGARPARCAARDRAAPCCRCTYISNAGVQDVQMRE
jgi:hypothetical protein